MDIEHLTKLQIVLLVLLVSFVTSIATGIVTVTLLEEAPPVVTQTINRIVEHTIERVVPGETQTATVIETEKTVVVNEEDLITQAIEKNTDKIVQIFRNTEDGSVYVGAGALVSKDGVVAAATDGSILSSHGSYFVILSSGKEIEGNLVLTEREGNSTALLRLTFTEEDGVVPPSITYGDINRLKLGQTTLTLAGRVRTSIALGIISGLDEEEVEVEELSGSEEGFVEESLKEPRVISVLQAIETNIDSSKIEKGGVLLNLFGEVIGISTFESRLRGSADFTPIQVVQSQIIELAKIETQVEAEAE